MPTIFMDHWSQPRLNGSPPLPRSNHTATAFGKKIVVFGGACLNFSKSFNDLHIWDIGFNFIFILLIMIFLHYDFKNNYNGQQFKQVVQHQAQDLTILRK